MKTIRLIGGRSWESSAVVPALLLIVWFAPLAVACQKPVDATGFIERRYINIEGKSMRYLLFTPKHYDRHKKYPLVLWLHGGGARGDNPKTILSWGDKHGPLFLARADNQSAYPCFILAPQCPAGKLWANPFADTMLAEIRLAMEILESIQTEFAIDSTRLYVLGISMGGYAIWDLIAHKPELFAAAVPICGGGNPSKARLMVSTPVWAFHGDGDELVAVGESRQMIEAIKREGGNPKYTEYKGVGHNAWERAFAERDFLKWIFSQTRK